jgi:hypothetical protein
MKRDIELDCLQTIAKNLDFSLRVKDKKSVLIISDMRKKVNQHLLENVLQFFAGFIKEKF